jgi:hypothetical protein
MWNFRSASSSKLILIPYLAAASSPAAASSSCLPCHAKIVESYAKTGMARSSGPTSALPFDKNFLHKAGGREIELRCFIGSGHVGRSFVHKIENHLLQAPISYYSATGKWNLSPGYKESGAQHIARPIEYPCLHCHTSGAKLEDPFAEPGVTCERCHGDASEHIKGNVKAIVNPAKLAPRLRDSVCEQCHLTGAARVERLGHRMQDFKPGENWGDYVATFIGAKGKAAATDHSEQLAASRCKRASGDKLWCATCHNPHEATAATAQPCLQCHAQAHKQNENCIACHMPKATTREGDHVAYTNHTIPRTPGQKSEPKLSVFPGTEASDRDWALAFNRKDGLAKAARQDDPAAIAALAQLSNGPALYERLQKLDPNHPALANLGVYRAMQGRLPEAIEIWRRVFSRYPWMSEVGINLLRAQPEDTGIRRRLLLYHPGLANRLPATP